MPRREKDTSPSPHPRHRVKQRHSQLPPSPPRLSSPPLGRAVAPPLRKPTLADALDALSGPAARLESIMLSRAPSSLLSSLSGLSTASPDRASDRGPNADSEADSDEDIEFEDVPGPASPDVAGVVPALSGDLELTLRLDAAARLESRPGARRGPSRIQRRIRMATHSLHVQLLLRHNSIRNYWLCDPEVQAVMMSHLTPRLWDEVDRWRALVSPSQPLCVIKADDEGSVGRSGRRWMQQQQQHQANEENEEEGEEGRNEQSKWRSRKEKTDAGKEREKKVQMKADTTTESTSVSATSDPLHHLLRVLVAWWRHRFRETAPGLRKRGYMSMDRLDGLMRDWAAGPHDQDRFGERIRSIDEFRALSRDCEGSRDVGAQLFTALLRALGVEARLVANLQPIGFGFGRAEEALDSDGQTASASPPVLDLSPARSQSATERFDQDLDFPHYWTEALSPSSSRYIPIDPLVRKVVATSRQLTESLEPRGRRADAAMQVIGYVVGFSADGTAKDLTTRYLRGQTVPGRSKGTRMPPERVPVYDRHGRVVRHIQRDFFHAVMAPLVRRAASAADDLEDECDLKPSRAASPPAPAAETLGFYKSSAEFVLQRHLKREEAVRPGALPVRTFWAKAPRGGDEGKRKVKSEGQGEGEGKDEGEPVYRRADLVPVKSAETWHKQGRAPRSTETPLKLVPYRAATLNRRRAVAETERATGRPCLQGLFALEQTELIIPPPIQDGVIPKNEYGNIDMFAEHMCPAGAVHLAIACAASACRRVGVDFAEAVVGFEFGNRMAVPVISGVVVAAEHAEQVRQEAARQEEARARRADGKRRDAALTRWRRFLIGLRVVAHVRSEYGDFGVWAAPDVGDPAAAYAEVDAASTGGGFVPDGYEEAAEPTNRVVSSFFPTADDEDLYQEETVLVERSD